jgi:hypothetical protein
MHNDLEMISVSLLLESTPPPGLNHMWSDDESDILWSEQGDDILENESVDMMDKVNPDSYVRDMWEKSSQDGNGSNEEKETVHIVYSKNMLQQFRNSSKLSKMLEVIDNKVSPKGLATPSIKLLCRTGKMKYNLYYQ